MPAERVNIEGELVIEDNLLKSLSPAYFVENILGSARVKIKNNIVINTTAWQAMYSLVWMVLVTFSCSFFEQYYFKAFFHKDLLMYLSCAFGTGVQNISYFFNIFVNRFTQRENNVKIYTMLQKVDRMLQLDKCTYYTDFQYRLNIVVILMIVVGFFCGFAANAIALLDEPAYTMFFAFGLLSIYTDNVLGVGMMYFLALRARIFNKIIKHHIEEYKGTVEKEPKTKTLKKTLLSLVIPTVETSSINLPQDKWLQCLQDLMKSYKIITELFSFSIFNISLTVLVWTFIVITAMVVGLRSGLYPLSAIITIGVWAGFYYVQLTTSAIISDWFITEIKKMKLLCIRLISYDYEGPFQKTASDIINAIHNDTPIFAVYGIFVLDKTLPLEIIGVIASNVFVLIQFLI